MQLAVLAELDWDQRGRRTDGVTANAGVITSRDKWKATPRNTRPKPRPVASKGCWQSADEIEVQVPFERKREDGEIAAAVLDRLAWDVSVPRDSVKVVVDQGWVTLTGEVVWNYQRKAAEQDVQRRTALLGFQTTFRSNRA